MKKVFFIICCFVGISLSAQNQEPVSNKKNAAPVNSKTTSENSSSAKPVPLNNPVLESNARNAIGQGTTAISTPTTGTISNKRGTAIKNDPN